MKRSRKWIDISFEHQNGTNANDFETAWNVAPKSSSMVKTSKSSDSKQFLVGSRSSNVSSSKNVKECSEWNKSLWYQINTPSSVLDLCVNSKKVKEISAALDIKHRNSSVSKREANIIVLKGPSGCGKSCVVETVGNMLNCDVRKFELGVSSGVGVHSDQNVSEESELNEFTSFLLSSHKNSLTLTHSDSGNSKPMLLWVPELPNVFLLSISKLELVLSQYLHSNLDLNIVFEITEYGNKKAISFSNKFIAFNCVTVITMNPLAPTFITKGLQSLVGKLPKDLKTTVAVSSSLVKQIVDSSNGDMRLAVNTLQFLSSRSSRFSTDWLSTTSYKDFTLGLFHGIGKVLYPKRGLKAGSSCTEECKKCNIKPLITNISEVIESCSSVSSQFYLSLLEENVCDLNQCSLETLMRCLDDFILCDSLNSLFCSFAVTSGSSDFQLCPHLICTSSVMFWLSKCGVSEGSGRGFAPIRKPTPYFNSKYCQSNKDDHNNSYFAGSHKAFGDINAYGELIAGFRTVNKYDHKELPNDESLFIDDSEFFVNDVDIEDFD